MVWRKYIAQKIANLPSPASILCAYFRNLDIRDAILQLLNVIRDGNKKISKHDESEAQMGQKVIKKNYG